MAVLNYTHKTHAVKVLEWTDNNLELVEGLLGPNVVHYEEGTLYIASSGGRTLIPSGYNIIATAPTAYSAGPPEVVFVPGVFVEVISDAALASNYTVVP